MIAKRVKIIVLFVIVLLSISGCSKDDDNLNTIQDQFVGTWYSEKYYYDKDSGLLYPLGDIYDYPVTGITFLKNGTFSSYGLLPYTEGKYTVEVKKDANTGGEYFNIYLYKNNKVVNTIYVKK